jgi:hypothetical protein
MTISFKTRLWSVPLLTLIAVSYPVQSARCTGPADSSVSVRIVADEADAVLSILAKNRVHDAITAQNWERLFTSEGYVRLKKREASVQRAFTDDEFKRFVLSDSLAAKFDTLAGTLDRWKGAEITAAAWRALAYLPAGAEIRTKIYPVIKPKVNSFVFEVTTDPAIFLYLNPEVSREKFGNTLAHEFHHIGYAHSCAGVATQLSGDSGIPANTRTVLEWIGAFGEGFAMLAAAGGPDVHPHAVSGPAERARWDNDMRNFNADVKKVDRFFLDILENTLSPDQIQETAGSFFGIQGPWYTVGWKMAVTIERRYGRPRLIECLCDPRALLTTYNQAVAGRGAAAGESQTLWSPALIKAMAQHKE